MEDKEFFSVLKTEADLNDQDIALIANIFSKEKSRLKHLPLLTNEDLKEIVIHYT
jgi:hypothetical protein